MKLTIAILTMLSILSFAKSVKAIVPPLSYEDLTNRADTVVEALVEMVACSKLQPPHSGGNTCAKFQDNYEAHLKVLKQIKGSPQITLILDFQTLTLNDSCTGQPLRGPNPGERAIFYMYCDQNRRCRLVYPNSFKTTTPSKQIPPQCNKITEFKIPN